MPRPIRKRLHPKVPSSNAIDHVKAIQEDDHLEEADTVGLRVRVETHLDSPLRDISNAATKCVDEDDDPFGFSKVERELKRYRSTHVQGRPREPSLVPSQSPQDLNEEKDPPGSDDSFLSMSDVREAEQRRRSLRTSFRVATASTPVSHLSNNTANSSSTVSSMERGRKTKRAEAEPQPSKRRRPVKTKELTALLPKRRSKKTSQAKATSALPSSDDIVCSDHDDGQSAENEDLTSKNRPARKSKQTAVNKAKNIGAKRGRLPMVKNAPRDSAPRRQSKPSDESDKSSGRKKRLRMYDDLDKFTLEEEVVYGGGTELGSWR